MCSCEEVLLGKRAVFLSNPDSFSVLFRHVSMVNLEPSVGVTKAIRPSVPGLATPSMPISESALCPYSHPLFVLLMPSTGDFFLLPLCLSDAWPLR